MIKLNLREFLKSFKTEHPEVVQATLHKLLELGMIDRYLEVRGHHYETINEIPKELKGKLVETSEIEIIYQSII